MFTVENFLEAFNGIFHFDEFTRDIGKYLCNVERLGEEARHATRAADDLLVLVGELLVADDLHRADGRLLLHLDDEDRALRGLVEVELDVREVAEAPEAGDG